MLAKITNAIALVSLRLRVARRRYKRLRRRGHHIKAQRTLGQIKRLVQRKHNLKQTKAQLEAEAAAIRAANKITIKGDKVTGGTVRQRVVAAAHASASACASGRRDNFYSQGGAWRIDRCITGPPRGSRDDCSSWLTSAHHSAGAPDPNDQGYRAGYTGTLYAGTKPISRDHLQPGDIIIYGSPPGHHTELYVGPGDRTIGHGSSPVDYGVIDLFGDGDYHCRRVPGV